LSRLTRDLLIYVRRALRRVRLIAEGWRAEGFFFAAAPPAPGAVAMMSRFQFWG